MVDGGIGAAWGCAGQRRRDRRSSQKHLQTLIQTGICIDQNLWYIIAREPPRLRGNHATLVHTATSFTIATTVFGNKGILGGVGL
jgi:hypothetical protein